MLGTAWQYQWIYTSHAAASPDGSHNSGTQSNHAILASCSFTWLQFTANLHGYLATQLLPSSLNHCALHATRHDPPCRLLVGLSDFPTAGFGKEFGTGQGEGDNRILHRERQLDHHFDWHQLPTVGSQFFNGPVSGKACCSVRSCARRSSAENLPCVSSRVDRERALHCIILHCREGALLLTRSTTRG